MNSQPLPDVVQQHLDSLTKPPGSLGRLEEILVQYAAIRGQPPPLHPRAALFLFCADHGITAEGVSAWPSEVTRAMVLNFTRGGAAINVLCRQHGITPFIADMGVAGPPVEGTLHCRIAAGTENFARQPAMTRAHAQAAIDAGGNLARSTAPDFDVFLCGEMGIGNTTAASAMLSAYTGLDPDRVTGPGAGLAPAAIHHKAEVIRRALALHTSRDPMDIASAFGGFEILAIAGVILHSPLPVILDGFISCAAALIAQALDPSSLAKIIYSHRSAETGHRLMLQHLNARPLLDLDMRLGEGSAAALAFSIFQSACRLYHEMATLESLNPTSPPHPR